jgi:exopolyphosphatase/guanosine-5'-triphosphate,3'-diphosphate pyrophosphatase
VTAGKPVAALDVGSNTVRLLVAREQSGHLEPILDESEMVRLGKGVDRTGRLDPERAAAAIEAIRRMKEKANEAEASSVVAIATSAVRDAADGQDFVRRVRDETGVEVEIVSGDREAELTYRGASLGLTLDGAAIFADLGGGSTEIIAADAGAMRWAKSLPMGSGRLTERHVEHDPPTPEELDAVAADVDKQLAGLEPVQPRQAVFTGGTASHVLLLAGLEGTTVPLAPRTLEEVIELVSSRTAAEIVRDFRVREERARVLAAGIRAIQAIAQHYGVRAVTITRHGIREGMILDHLSA